MTPIKTRQRRIEQLKVAIAACEKQIAENLLSDRSIAFLRDRLLPQHRAELAQLEKEQQ